MRARDVMSSPVVTVTAGTTVKCAANLLVSHGFTALPVVDEDGRLIGIVTEADLVRDRFPRDPRYCSACEGLLGVDGASRVLTSTVGEVMTTPVVGMGAGTDVVDLVSAMLEEPVRSMPIVDGSTVIGIVTRRDLLRTLVRDDQAVATGVRRRLAMVGGLADAVAGVNTAQIAGHPGKD
jgi:CBS domain-containing protein